uniref:CCDC113/CCDC96 coiled-coil domain-containing protein n=1 Tax=Strombidium rassoulzadegani TaxID=1082188 RepID=A0A7S3CLM4_9SPIT|mmetsp:Transcript_16135/g.27288  ORF Transcript_16135/g.27288 Transcript_16135/m.27288 type:complete len:273 (+) Transcript_16135:1564-2382(+)
MNEHKYLNTLANVHQVRINLKETQDRYNKMAAELQAKLNEKQAKCYEIEQQFKELKRSVASNAVFSRTGKKIPKKTLDEWEESESLKDQEVQQYRLQNISLRNRLANKEKILKKKEQLADGLHLIDFEQLKIENQTLNEKIEERNEELHKLRKKITTTVVILSHTREKLQFVQEKNNTDRQQLLQIIEQLNNEKNEQSRLKKNREKLQKLNQRLKQQTGIVNKKELKEDYDRRDKEKLELLDKIKQLQNKHANLTRIINQASDIQMKNKMGA